MDLEAGNYKTRVVRDGYRSVIADQELANALANFHLQFPANYFPISGERLKMEGWKMGNLESLGITVYDQVTLLPKIIELGIIRSEPRMRNTAYSKDSMLVFRGLAFVNNRDFCGVGVINTNPRGLVDRFGELLGEHSPNGSLFYPLPDGDVYRQSFQVPEG